MSQHCVASSAAALPSASACGLPGPSVGPLLPHRLLLLANFITLQTDLSLKRPNSVQVQREKSAQSGPLGRGAHCGQHSLRAQTVSAGCQTGREGMEQAQGASVRRFRPLAALRRLDVTI